MTFLIIPSRAIDAVKKAFKDTESAVTSILSFNQQAMQAAEAQTANDAFVEAEQKLTACFTAYNVGLFYCFSCFCL
jgi:hypothetical protein